ncbi:MAG: winged helix-turn-helix domain-containing protein [Methanobrevibacter sp.]|uniref:winged helix-turn-helix domain-containing protein n=1 Tax=Methanobrevibacter sp. TaxID=66852 RepID=UPI0026DF0BEE|nr:winged helix-turn-helix domain-containing protein [Methanobrevibacter sp.]MDO5848419.1 winged helix-turn-helix domain-containing protein [Methanobrevibacter sp.]
MDDKTLILTEFIKQSPNRTKVLKSIGNDVLKPTDITNKTNIHINNVSRSLKQMKEKNIVYLLNPNSKKGRLYKLTEDGVNVLKNLK